MTTQNRFYSNTAVITTIANSTGMNAVETDLAVVSNTGWPTSFPFLVRLEPDSLNEELVLVSSGLGTIGSPYIVTRGYDGTSAKTHGTGVTVEHGFSQIDFADPQVHLNLTGSTSAAHGLPANAWSGGTLQLIASTTLSSSGVITFSSIPSTFTHLRIEIMAVSNDTGGVGFSDMAIQFNADTNSHYSYNFIFMNNSSTISPTNNAATTSIHCGFATNGGVNPTSGAGNGVSVIEIPYYSVGSLSKNVTWASHASSGIGAPNNHQEGWGGGIWGNNTAAISSIVLSPANSPFTYITGSRASLYGIL